MVVSGEAAPPLAPLGNEPVGPQAEECSCDVLVVGAGPAGLSAAIAAAEAGADVVVLDERTATGGQYAKPGSIICRQTGTKWHPGKGVDIGRDQTWSQLVDHAYSHFVEPELIQPTIVYDWPIELSPFARTTDDDESIVERFEVVVSGMEIANAFSELNDSEEQEQRFGMQDAERAAGDAAAEPGDPDYVEAMSYGTTRLCAPPQLQPIENSSSDSQNVSICAGV